MAKNSNKVGRGNLVGLVVCAGIVFGVWASTDYVAGRLRGIKVKEMKQLSDAYTSPAKPTFHRISAKAGKSGNNGDSNSSPFEDVFASVEPSPPVLDKVVAPVAPPASYASLIRPLLQVDGVTDNGAIVSGRFVPLGKRVEHLGNPVGDTAPLPVTLIGVTRNVVKFKVGSEQVEVTVSGEGY